MYNNIKNIKDRVIILLTESPRVTIISIVALLLFILTGVFYPYVLELGVLLVVLCVMVFSITLLVMDVIGLVYHKIKGECDSMNSDAKDRVHDRVDSDNNSDQ